MAATEVIREFLLSLRYQIDQNSQQRFAQNLKQQEAAALRLTKFHDELGRKVKDLGLFATATAAAFTAFLVQTSRNYEQLYYVVQRTNTAAEGLAKLQFAYGQIGLSGEQARATIVRLNAAIKTSPGLASVFRGISGDDWYKTADKTKALLDFIDRLRHRAPAVAIAQAGMFGFSPDETLRLMASFDDLKKSWQDWNDQLKAAGLTQEKYTQFLTDARNLSNDLRKVWEQLALIGAQAFEAVFGPADKVLKTVSDLLTKVEKFNTSHPFAAVAEALVGITASLTGAVALAVNLSRIVFRTAGAAAGLGGAAGAARGLGVAGGALAVGGAITAAIAGGVALHEFIPKNSDDWLREAKKDKSAEAPTLKDVDNWLSWLGRLRHGLGFQHGGIVPADVHPGEMILPAGISKGLQALYSGHGAQSIAEKTYEAISWLASTFHLWLVGGGTFAPRVVPVSAPGERSFSMLDALGYPAIPGVGEPTGGAAQRGVAAHRPRGRWAIGATDPLGIIEHFESAGRNVMNFINDARHTASGFFQITNSTWRQFAGQVAGAGQYAAAILAPYSIQRAVAQAIYNAQGFGPWENYNPRLHSYLSQMQTTRMAPGNSVRYGDRSATLNQTNHFLVQGGAAAEVTGRLTRITDRLAGDTIRNFQQTLF